MLILCELRYKFYPFLSSLDLPSGRSQEAHLDGTERNTTPHSFAEEAGFIALWPWESKAIGQKENQVATLERRKISEYSLSTHNC